LIQFAEGTDVKWVEGDHDANNKAHTAPKSQKYWDEHKIDRPDYAKTDAEIAQEQGGSSGSTMKWIVLLAILVAVGYYLHLGMQGQKLGGSSNMFRRASEEEARQARLAKFERAASTGKAE
jgi:hypothetical protein